MPVKVTRLPLSSDPLKFVCARCSILFALHQLVVIVVSCPGASTIPRPERVHHLDAVEEIGAIADRQPRAPGVVSVCS